MKLAAPILFNPINVGELYNMKGLTFLILTNFLFWIFSSVCNLIFSICNSSFLEVKSLLSFLIDSIFEFNSFILLSYLVFKSLFSFLSESIWELNSFILFSYLVKTLFSFLSKSIFDLIKSSFSFLSESILEFNSFISLFLCSYLEFIFFFMWIHLWIWYRFFYFILS